jgi:hypothetical protein
MDDIETDKVEFDKLLTKLYQDLKEMLITINKGAQ